MSDDWIDARMEDVLSGEDFETFLDGAPYDRVLAAVDINGNVVALRTIDAEGVAGGVWTPDT